MSNMSIKDYRRQLERQVAQESARAEPESVPEDPRLAHVAPLERLADPNEAPEVRLAALGLLKQLAISSPTFPEWRPIFFEALRRALTEPRLRAAALEVLTHHRDRYAQEKLLAGLREPDQALVPIDQALRLLSSDPHADVRDVARSVAADPPNEESLLQAMKILAGDPGSVEGFRSLLGDGARSLAVRKLAATALNNLAPELLPSVAQAESAPAVEDVESAPAADGESALAKHIGTLLRVRREPAHR